MDRFIAALLVGTLAAFWYGAGEDESPSSLPDGMAGFSGMLQGTVVVTKDEAFTLKVAEVVRTWKGTKAENPQSAVGKDLVIRAKHKNHVKFIGTLKDGESLTIEAIDQGGKLYVLELNGEQRKRAGAGD